MENINKRSLLPEERERIERKYREAMEKNYYELLDVPFNATRDEIKKAYRSLSKEFHPDRYFRVELNDLKDKLEVIFHTVTKAHNTLIDPLMRRTYNMMLIEEKNDGVEIEEAGVDDISSHEVSYDLEEKERREKRIKEIEEVKRSLLQRISMKSTLTRVMEDVCLKRILKAKEFFNEANKYLSKGDIGRAYSNIQLAVSYDEKNEVYKKLKNDIQKKMSSEKAKTFFEKGRKAESMMYDSDALKNYEEAMKLDDKNPVYPYSIAQIYLRNKDMEKAIRYAEKTVYLDNKNKEYLFFLASLYETVNEKNKAKQCYQKVLKIDKNDKIALEALKKLK